MLSVGDVVRHRILGSEKVVVGIGQDRYLCVYREDVQGDGYLRPNARIAMHRQENLHKIGRIDAVNPVALDQLFGKELKQIRHLRKRNFFKEEVVPYLLFAVASVLIALAFFSSVDKTRSHIETFFFKKVEEKKMELMKEGVQKVREQREAERVRQKELGP